jgi:hypothetical protein
MVLEEAAQVLGVLTCREESHPTMGAPLVDALFTRELRHHIEGGDVLELLGGVVINAGPGGTSVDQGKATDGVGKYSTRLYYGLGYCRRMSEGYLDHRPTFM